VVSIRASLQQRGERKSQSCRYRKAYSFQSAPHFSSEANLSAASYNLLSDVFQSAPHFSSEANRRQRESERNLRSFNPRLTSAARRTSGAGSTFFAKKVSIRASLQQRGEHDN